MTTTHCGDSCGLIDFTMAVAGDRLLPEERMKLAIEAVSSGKMSQRGAAAKYGVAESTLRSHLKKVRNSAHPAETQPEPAISQNRTAKLTTGEVRSALRQLLRDNDAPSGVAQNPRNGITSPEARGWLQFAGIPIPPELDGRTQPFNPSTTPSSPTPAQSHGTEQQGLHADNSLPVVSDWSAETDPEPEHPAFADHFDISAVREHVNREIQQSDRPADFKRAIELLTELDVICTDAWYRRHPEPWNHDDWAHVSSEIEALHSIVGQRAAETADELLRKSTAVEVKSTAVC